LSQAIPAAANKAPATDSQRPKGERIQASIKNAIAGGSVSKPASALLLALWAPTH
jgi:hypothetical protein